MPFDTSVEPRLAKLVELCKAKLHSEAVWLFGSRARGDHRPDSDWDILVIVPDDASDEMIEPEQLGNIRREAGLPADVLAVRDSDFWDAQDSVTTLSRIVMDEGIRIDV